MVVSSNQVHDLGIKIAKITGVDEDTVFDKLYDEAMTGKTLTKKGLQGMLDNNKDLFKN